MCNFVTVLVLQVLHVELMDSSRLFRQEADIKQHWLFSHRGITLADPCEATETLSILITKTARSHSLQYRSQLGMKASFSISHEGKAFCFYLCEQERSFHHF